MFHLTFADRKLIYACIQAGQSNAQIAREVGVHRSTIGRELKRNGGRENYQPMQANRAAKARQREAMPQRNTIGLGMLLFTVLEQRYDFYPYLSKTHEKLSFLEMFIRHPYDWAYDNPSELRNRDTLHDPIRLSIDFSPGGCMPLIEPESSQSDYSKSGSPAISIQSQTKCSIPKVSIYFPRMESDNSNKAKVSEKDFTKRRTYQLFDKVLNQAISNLFHPAKAETLEKCGKPIEQPSANGLKTATNQKSKDSSKSRATTDLLFSIGIDALRSASRSKFRIIPN